ncbi:MAG: hypothetical protein ACREBU_22665, partial [Nitrososphaera sp.]
LLNDLSLLYKGKPPKKSDDLSILEEIPSLEEVISLFHQKDILEPEWRPFPEFSTAKHNRIRTLDALILYTIAKAQEGPVCGKHKRLAEQIEQGDIVLSYNYDTIFDSALKEKRLLSDDGYEMDFHRVFSGGQWVQPEQEPSNISMFKLHGSFNWLQCTNCGCRFLYRDNLTFRYLDLAERYTFEECPRCHNRSLMAILVPPLIGKAYKEYGVSFLWSLANDKIVTETKNIEEVIIIGYRLPESDIASLLLFRNTIQFLIKDKHKQLIVVNPDKNVLKRFKNVLLKANALHYSNMDEYIGSFKS